MDSASLTVGTYNILNPYYALKWSTQPGYDLVDGQKVDNWRKTTDPSGVTRKEKLATEIHNSGCDVICLQEVTPALMMELLAELPDYSYGRFAGHRTDSEEDLHGVAIIYKGSKVDLECVHTIKTLEHTGWYRGCLYLDFKIHGTPGTWRVASVHAKGYNPATATAASRKDGFDEIQEIIKATNSEEIDHFIIAGDMNEDSSQMSLENCRLDVLTSAGYRTDGNVAPTEPATGRKIDWIFYRGPNSMRPIDTSRYQDTTASDHLLSMTAISV